MKDRNFITKSLKVLRNRMFTYIPKVWENLPTFELHSVLLVVLYTCSIVACVYFFVQWNHVATRTYNIECVNLRPDSIMSQIYDSISAHIHSCNCFNPQMGFVKSAYECDKYNPDENVQKYFRLVNDGINYSAFFPEHKRKQGDFQITIPMTFENQNQYDGEINCKISTSDNDSILYDWNYIEECSIYYHKKDNISYDSLDYIAMSHDSVSDDFKRYMYKFTYTRSTTEPVSIKRYYSYAYPLFQGLHYQWDLQRVKTVSDKLFFTNIEYDYLDIDRTFDYSMKENSNFFFRPGWLNCCDISQGYYRFSLKPSAIDEVKLEINFIGATTFSQMYPEPDVITMNSIVFRDQEKVKIIKRNGLEFHASFNEMVNRQNVRNFFLTTILSLLIAGLLRELVIVSYYKIVKRM